MIAELACSLDDWNPAIPFEEFIIQPNILLVDATLTMPDGEVEDWAETLLGLFRELDGYNSTIRFDIAIRIEDTQAEVIIPSQHQLDIDLIRADLERLAAMRSTKGTRASGGGEGPHGAAPAALYLIQGHYSVNAAAMYRKNGREIYHNATIYQYPGGLEVTLVYAMADKQLHAKGRRRRSKPGRKRA